ncbi:MAG: hypothetical protein M3298_07515 [Thermoproteota archaeon]|nr:hypothetical protein [Thermoproteota archaeon]
MVVPASLAIAVGTTLTLLAILHHYLNFQIVDTHTILLFASSTGGIAVGIIVLVAGYYYFQMNPHKLVEKILAEIKRRDTTSVRQIEVRRKNYYLHCISTNTLRITKDLARLENLIGKYSDDPPPKDWQIIRYTAERSRKLAEELEKKIVLDFAQIIDLVENSQLAHKFGVNSLYSSLYLFGEILKVDPEYNKVLLSELRKRIREQIEKWDETLSLLEEEKVNVYRLQVK